MKDEGRMKDEGWRAVLQMNKLTDKQTYHQEDIDLRSFNYMVYGEPKLWFGCLPVVLIGFSILSNIKISFQWLVLLEKLEKLVNSSQDSLAKWDHFVMKTVEIRNKVGLNGLTAKCTCCGKRHSWSDGGSYL